MNDQYERETTEKHKRNYTNDNGRKVQNSTYKGKITEKHKRPLQMRMAEEYKRPFTKEKQRKNTKAPYK
jgi:hypothetical protein